MVDPNGDSRQLRGGFVGGFVLQHPQVQCGYLDHVEPVSDVALRAEVG